MVGWEQLEFHELAELFPPMADDEFAELIEEIAERGFAIDRPIVLHEGKILDGRNRFRACLQLAAEHRLSSPPPFVEWHENGMSAARWVYQANWQRRQLNASQRAAVAVEFLPYFEKEAAEVKQLLSGTRTDPSSPEQAPLPLEDAPQPDSEPEAEQVGELIPQPAPPAREASKPTSRNPRARGKAAAATGVNERYVQDMKKIAAADRELARLVKAGKITIPEAKRELKRRAAAKEREKLKAAAEAKAAERAAQRARPRRPNQLPTERTCGCPANHLGCMSAGDWQKCQVGVWEFSYDGRDSRDKELHPAMYPVSLPKRFIRLLTHEGELVLDPFVGSGSTLVAAAETHRNAVGFDLNPEYIQVCEGRLAQLGPPQLGAATQLAVCGDARGIARRMRPGSVALIITSPPYADLLNRPRANKSRAERDNEQLGKVEQYSQDSRDLGTLGAEAFARALGSIFARLRPLLTPTGHCVINVADTWLGGEIDRRVPVHYLVKAAMDRAGYQLRNTIIWDRNNLVNNTSIFGWPNNFITMGTTVEYLLDFVAKRTP